MKNHKDDKFYYVNFYIDLQDIKLNNDLFDILNNNQINN